MKPGNFLNVLEGIGRDAGGEDMSVAGQCKISKDFNENVLCLFSNLDIENSEHFMG